MTTFLIILAVVFAFIIALSVFNNIFKIGEGLGNPLVNLGVMNLIGAVIGFLIVRNLEYLLPGDLYDGGETIVTVGNYFTGFMLILGGLALFGGIKIAIDDHKDQR